MIAAVNPAMAPALSAVPRRRTSRQKKAPINAELKPVAKASIPAFCILAWKILVINAVRVAILGPTVVITIIEAKATGNRLGNSPTNSEFSPKKFSPAQFQNKSRESEVCQDGD